MSEKSKIHVGSRKSELALIQTRYVISLLKEIHPEKEFEIVTMSTLGDRILNIPLPKIGEKSLFTKELEASLATGVVDFVVHSLKDLPTILPDGMAIGAVLTREDPRDALVLRKDLKPCSLSTLREGTVIGTSSLRRAAQLGKKHPHLKVENIRGNLNTRLKKLDDLDKYHAIILASAGLIRIGWKDRISKILDPEEMLYAVGQGALAVECRANDDAILKLLEPLYDTRTALQVLAERSYLKTLGGGCSAPVAVSTELTSLNSNELRIKLQGAVWSLDGKEEVKDDEEITVKVKNFTRCATCKYNNNGSTQVVGDIECLKECLWCPNSTENRAKKIKLDISNDILKDDPHQHCPIELPVGADFMGKCPYLEGDLKALQSACPVKGMIEGSNISYDKCPFRKDEQTEGSTNEIINNVRLVTENNCTEDDKLFVGLAPHGNIDTESMEKVRLLGESLAKKLMSKGALEIMTKAQSAIHAQVQN